MIEFRCPHCKELFSIPEEFVGTAGTCRKCGNPITIEAAVTEAQSSGSYPKFTQREPSLAVVHVETTGSSSRRNSIIELGAVQIDLNGNQVDSYWSFANPSVPIPDKIVDRTGITDEMVMGAPFPSEVVQQWFNWLGSHALVFCQHGHFHAKFLSAALLNHDIEPPMIKMIDVVHWAKDLALPVEHFRLKNLLEHIQYTGAYGHRSMDVCEGLRALVPHLLRRQVGVQGEQDGGVLGMIRGRTAETLPRDNAFSFFEESAETLEQMCGPNFVARTAYEQRQVSGSDPVAAAGASNGNGNAAPTTQMHMGEWFAEMKVRLEGMLDESGDDASTFAGDPDAPWREIVWRASDEKDPSRQCELCIEAVRLGAVDPWPYEHLVDVYIHSKKYDSACKVADRYFKMDAWKNPRWADTSLKLLKRLNQLEHHLAKSAR